MRQIDSTIDSSFCSALTCAELRFPKAHTMPRVALDSSVSLRFGLLGIAASQFILKDVPVRDQPAIIPDLRFFGTMIAEQLERSRLSASAHIVSEHCVDNCRNAYSEMFDRYIELRQMNGPSELILAVLVEEFNRRSLQKFSRGFLRFWHRRTEREFKSQAQKSLQYALNFLERRRYGVEEVAEIALIGE